MSAFLRFGVPARKDTVGSEAWNHDGTLDEILHLLRAAHLDAGDIDNELWCVDGSSVRAARCAVPRGAAFFVAFLAAVFAPFAYGPWTTAQLADAGLQALLTLLIGLPDLVSSAKGALL